MLHFTEARLGYGLLDHLNPKCDFTFLIFLYIKGLSHVKKYQIKGSPLCLAVVLLVLVLACYTMGKQALESPTQKKDTNSIITINIMLSPKVYSCK